MKPAKTTLEAIEAALEELKVRNAGAFDGVIGNLPEEVSIALQDILSFVRNWLLDKYDEDTVRQMLKLYSRPKPHSWPVSDGDELALSILFILNQALFVNPHHYRILLSGRDGLIGSKIRKGGSKGGHNKRKGPEAAPKKERILKAAKRFKSSQLASDEKPMAEKIAAMVGCSPRYVRHVLSDKRKSSS